MDLEEPKPEDKESEMLTEPYTVGPGHPPKTYPFRKGTSGNPKGRPKKPPKSHDQLSKELSKRINLTIKDKATRMMPLEVVYQQLASLAMSGEPRAMKLFDELVEKARLRKNNYQEETEEPIEFVWTPKLEEMYQGLCELADKYGEAKRHADENKIAKRANPDNKPQAHSPVTSALSSSQENTSLSAASDSKSTKSDPATAAHQSTSDTKPTNQESPKTSLASGTTISTKLMENEDD